MKGFTKLGRTLLALTVLFILPLSDAMSQDFIQASTGTYNATCGGVIKINDNAGKIDNSSGNNLGTSAYPVPGVVDYASGTGTQIVLGSGGEGGSFYYTSLFLSGAAEKTLQDAIFVTGNCTTGFLTGYTALEDYPYYASGGATTYGVGETFTYLSDNAQNIFPDEYAFLDLNGTGVKTILANDEVTVTGEIALPTGDLTVSGTLNTGDASSLLGDVTILGTVDDAAEINVGAEAITFAGALDVTDYSTLNTGAGGIITTGATLIDGTTALINVEAGNVEFNEDLTITEGTLFAGDAAVAGDIGTVTIGADNDATIGALGELDFGTNTFLEITGTISNGGDGSNLAFDCSSTVTYNGAAGQLVMPTLGVAPNTYGNLILDNGSKIGGSASYGYDVSFCGDFTLNGGGNFDLYKSGTNSGTLFATNVDAVVTYAGLEEVVGSFNRVTDVDAGTYTLNNTNTVVTLAADADNPTSIETLVLPGTNPEQYESTTDVNRKITFTYSGNPDLADNEFEYDMKVGYLYNEGPNDGGLWGNLSTQSSLRMYEANAAGFEKVGTGDTPTRTEASTTPTDVMGQFSLTGIKQSTSTVLDNGIGLFASTNDVLLRAGPTTFYSINAGRWSNPNTWDEGTHPSEDDNAEIRHMVYVGIKGGFAGTPGAPDNQITEESLYEATGDGAAANKITISGEAQFAGNYPSLVIGNMDNGNYVFKTKQTTGTTFVNNNVNAPATTFNATNGILTAFPTKGDVTGPSAFNGLWLVGFTGGVDDGIPHFKTNQIDNKGTINNEGIIEVGQ